MCVTPGKNCERRTKRLLGRAEGEGLQDASGHGLDEGDSVGDYVVPLGVGPRGLATQFPVSHALVAPAHRTLPTPQA